MLLVFLSYRSESYFPPPIKRCISQSSGRIIHHRFFRFIWSFGFSPPVGQSSQTFQFIFRCGISGYIVGIIGIPGNIIGIVRIHGDIIRIIGIQPRIDISHIVNRTANYFRINFTIQSMHIGVSEIVSIKTFAGCISSKCRRSPI